MFSTLALLSTPALAQEEGPPCAPLDQAEAYLAAEFQETRVAQGVVAGGRAILMFYASPQGTWTAVMVNHDKVACQVADGTDWQARSDPAPVLEEGL
jgi:hypothetical protein